MSTKPQLSSIELVEAIKKSKANRAAIMKRFGFMPHSIITLSRGALSNSLYSYRKENPDLNTSLSAGVHEKQDRLVQAGFVGALQSASTKSNGRGSGAVSVMAAELVEFFILYYAKAGDTYLNPFMGKGVEMQVAKKYGLHFYGYDCAEQFYPYTLSLARKIDDGKTTIQPILGDSRFPDQLLDGIGDFSFYSPPYWDIEEYGKEDAQLGRNKTYATFLNGMQEVAAAWLPKFKTPCWHVVNVNDFRKDGRFYPYHADICRIYQDVGWLLHDIWIVDGLVGGMPKAFAVDFNMKRIAPKVHEYCLVFKKG